MFDILFGWRKASKCKKLIKRIRCRLKLLKNKRDSMVRQSRQDMAQLIKLGYEGSAINRAEQLFKDECAVAVYEMLDNFCEFVILNLSYIRKHKDVPNDVNEAVSSLIFASARCGDLPELLRIRELFGERYGLRFATAAVDLLPGSLVNREMKEKLSTYAISVEVKYRMVDEIAKDYCLWPEVMALEYPSESTLHQEQENQGLNQNISTSPGTNEGTNVQTWESNSESVSISVCSSIVEQSSPEKLDSPVHSSKEEVCSPTIGDSEGRQSHKPVSSSESSPYDFPEEMIVYLDDIEEFQIQSSPKDGDHFQDQRLFMFKSYKLPGNETEARAESGSGRSVPMRGKNYKSFTAERSTQVYADYETHYTEPSHKHGTVRVEKKTTGDTDVKPEESCSPSRSENSLPPYSRAMTMPQQRPNVDLRERFPRSVSCPFQHSSHVHPKLPDYDEIAARFSALKKQCLQNKQPCKDR